MNQSAPDTAMPLDLLLVRHGHSEGNLAMEREKGGDPSLVIDPSFMKRGAADWRLTSLGQEQAREAGAWVREWLASQAPTGFDRMYCSSYARTRETAALMAIENGGWQLEPLLRERDWGLWEGMAKDDVAAKFPISLAQKQRNKFLWRPECGESTPDLDLRVRAMLGTFARELGGQRVVCVTHEDVMWAFRFRLEKLTIDQWLAEDDAQHRKIPNCGILHYTRADSAGAVHPKFIRVRLIDPATPDASENWWEITRRQFSNDDLMDQLRAIPALSSDQTNSHEG